MKNMVRNTINRFQKVVCITSLLIVFEQLYAFEKDASIAVLELAGNGVSVSNLGGFSNRLRTEMFNTDKFTVVERSLMNEILKEQKFQQSGCTTQECVIEVGQMLSVGYIVTGNVDKVGNLYSVAIRMVNVETGKIVKIEKEDCDQCQIEDVFKVTLYNLARKLAGLAGDRKVSKRTTVQNEEREIESFLRFKKIGLSEDEWGAYKETGLSIMDYKKIKTFGLSKLKVQELVKSNLTVDEFLTKEQERLQEEKKVLLEKQKKQDEIKKKKTIKAAKLSLKIITGTATVLLSGVALYYHNKVQDHIQKANDAIANYNAAESGVSSTELRLYKSTSLVEFDKADKYEKNRNQFFLLSLGFCAVFGISFTF
ncbi:MAG: hypothetical protein HQK83_02795 [Fibrobacteria bacterium]|nr:hypothetical protein [Fibrobacteria bacterium]